jgi:hypothetical protein
MTPESLAERIEKFAIRSGKVETHGVVGQQDSPA